jgi:hypothetical protein
MPTETKSLMAISLSCLVEGLDEEAVDVENRAENKEKARREAIWFTAKQQSTWNDGMAITRDCRSLLLMSAVVQVDICALSNHTDSRIVRERIVRDSVDALGNRRYWGLRPA